MRVRGLPLQTFERHAIATTMLQVSRFDISVPQRVASMRGGRCETMSEAMKTKRLRSERLFKDSWRPEDKALESAEEEALERVYGDEIARDRAQRQRQTPAIGGFEKAPSSESSSRDSPPRVGEYPEGLVRQSLRDALGMANDFV